MENLPLTGAQKSKLRALGQKLDATIKVGKEGLTPAFFTELSRALRARDLIKLRFGGEIDRPARSAFTIQIETEGHCTCVGAVGHTALFYKTAGDPSKSSLPAE
ncbi:MAG: YhbY family RNA-binding protein [Undibacterium sp.]|nr:YhbY family RNA-binding protein [Opitutaceae bacterium]